MKLERREVCGIIVNEIETPRLRLREITPSITREAFKHLTDHDVMNVLGFTTLEELEENRRRLESGIETYYITFRRFILISKIKNKVIGYCSYHTWRPSQCRAEIGYYLISDEYKNLRYMSEAFSHILQYGFEVMKLHRVEAYISPNNLPSKGLVRKFHFTYEGKQREDYLVNGVYNDSEIYSLLVGEYIKFFGRGEK